MLLAGARDSGPLRSSRTDKIPHMPQTGSNPSDSVHPRLDGNDVSNALETPEAEHGPDNVLFCRARAGLEVAGRGRVGART